MHDTDRWYEGNCHPGLTSGHQRFPLPYSLGNRSILEMDGEPRAVLSFPLEKFSLWLCFSRENLKGNGKELPSSRLLEREKHLAAG